MPSVPDYAGAIEISGTADEESGGIRRCRLPGGARVYFSPDRVQHVIIPEPLNKDRICLGHRGVWWAEIETQGEIAHGSMPFLGDCAVRHMGAVVAEMEESLFPALAAETHRYAGGAGRGASNRRSTSIPFTAARPSRRTTIPDCPSACVPDRCRMVIDRRFLIEEDIGEVEMPRSGRPAGAGARRGGRPSTTSSGSCTGCCRR